MSKMRWYIFYINFTFSKIIEQLTVHFLFYNAWGIILQFNAKAHDIKWKLGPPCNESNFNLSPAILVLFLIDNSPRLFSLAPLLTIVTQSLLLARAGLFNLPREKVEKTWICNRHRHWLGILWDVHLTPQCLSAVAMRWDSFGFFTTNRVFVLCTSPILYITTKW